MEETFKLSEDQKSELVSSFKLFEPDAQGLIHIRKIKSVVDELELAGSHSHRLHKKLSTSEPNSPNNPEEVTVTSTISAPESFPDGSETCSLDAFIKLIEDTMTTKEGFEETLIHAFRLLDVRRTGYIEAQDLRKAAEVLGETFQDDEEAQRLLNYADPAHNNKISFADFKAFFLKDLKL
jgi:Ca2+-binding EF-hand superfamily protein